MLKLLTIKDILVESCGFCSSISSQTFARLYMSASKFFSMIVEDSMFFTAAFRVGLLVARPDLNRRRSS